MSVSGNKMTDANSSQGRKKANIKNAYMEIWRNYKQLNTLNQRSLTLPKKKINEESLDVIVQLELKDETGKIKLGQVGSKYILGLLHTRVGSVCKALLGGQRWGRGRWPMSPPPQSTSPTGDTRRSSALGDAELIAAVSDGHSPLCHLGVRRDGSPSGSPRPLTLPPHPCAIPACRRPSSAGATVPAASRVTTGSNVLSASCAYFKADRAEII